jgi:hypothetical protein
MQMLGDQSRHFDQRNLFQKSKDSRDVWGSVELKKAIECQKKGEYEKALMHLGKGLHSIQDQYAHRDWNTGATGVIRHPTWYDDWTNPTNKQAAESTEKATKKYLQRFKELTR